MTKQELRNRVRQKRAELSPEWKENADREILRRIVASDRFREASAVLLYAPKKSEVNLLPLVSLLREKNIPVAFPKCDPEEKRMEFRILEPGARLAPGAYGIPEPPADAPVCAIDAHTLCLLPGMTYDPDGNRLGYGGGYYDRFLSDFPGVAAGVVYDSFLVRRVPTDLYDRPVAEIFTEERRIVCRREPEPETPELPVREPMPKDFSGKMRRIGKDLAAWWNSGDAHALHRPPVLVLVCLSLLILSRIVSTNLLTRESELPVMILFGLLTFVLPGLLYLRLRRDSLRGRILLRPIRPVHLWFTACCLILMISGSLLCSIITGGISSLCGNFTLYNAFAARLGGGFFDHLPVILAYGLLPAVGEELVFRAILCAEYEKHGVLTSVAAGAVFFAMIHFSFSNLLSYLFLGAILALSMYATRSLLTPILLHLCYNLFCLYGQPYLSAFYVNAGSNEIFLFCVVTVFLLFSAFAAGEARKIYHLYATANLDSSYTVRVPLKTGVRNLLRVLATPVAGACLILWIVFSIIEI